MIEKLADQIVSRFEELERDMSDPAVIGDRERYAEVGREYQQIAAANALVLEWRAIKDCLLYTSRSHRDRSIPTN